MSGERILSVYRAAARAGKKTKASFLASNRRERKKNTILEGKRRARERKEKRNLA